MDYLKNHPYEHFSKEQLEEVGVTMAGMDMDLNVGVVVEGVWWWMG